MLLFVIKNASHYKVRFLREFCRSMTTQKFFTKGTEFPPIKDDVLRLYSMRFCPFAQRTRLVLAHKHIPHEIVNVDLKNKPDWFVARNPNGTVPTLEKNGKILYETTIVNDFLDEVFPENKLLPADPYVKARQRIVMEQCAKLIPHFLKSINARKPEEMVAIEGLQEAFVPFENALEGKYFGGDSVALVDLHIWPFFERLPAMKILTGYSGEILDEKRFPRLSKWVKLMLEQPAVKACMFDTGTHVTFYDYLTGNPPQYNLGLKE